MKRWNASCTARGSAAVTRGPGSAQFQLAAAEGDAEAAQLDGALALLHAAAHARAHPAGGGGLHDALGILLLDVHGPARAHVERAVRVALAHAGLLGEELQDGWHRREVVDHVDEVRGGAHQLSEPVAGDVREVARLDAALSELRDERDVD